jgi:hypothetical protein
LSGIVDGLFVVGVGEAEIVLGDGVTATRIRAKNIELDGGKSEERGGEQRRAEETVGEGESKGVRIFHADAMDARSLATANRFAKRHLSGGIIDAVNQL